MTNIGMKLKAFVEVEMALKKRWEELTYERIDAAVAEANAIDRRCEIDHQIESIKSTLETFNNLKQGRMSVDLMED